MIVTLSGHTHLFFAKYGIHAQIQKVLSDGVKLLVDEGSQIPLKAGHHRPASKTPFKWCFDGGLVMA